MANTVTEQYSQEAEIKYEKNYLLKSQEPNYVNELKLLFKHHKQQMLQNPNCLNRKELPWK